MAIADLATPLHYKLVFSDQLSVVLKAVAEGYEHGRDIEDEYPLLLLPAESNNCKNWVL